MPTPLQPTERAIALAAEHLKAGHLVAFPTETVYGLGADATQDTAVARVFEAKGRPRFNPLIVHVTGLEAAAQHAVLSARAERLIAKFWPGPLTLVLTRRRQTPVSLLASAGLDTLALRAPDHPVAQSLLRAVGRPIVAPSANRSGRVSPTTAAHVVSDLSAAVAMILDGGPCRLGLESTVVDLSADEPKLLRPGALARAEVEAITGPLGRHEGGAIRSPGLMERHYAPGLPLRLGARDVAADEALLAFGPEPLQGALRMLNLSERGDTVEAAANLFAFLRALDGPPARAIAVMPIPATGLGEAINDRLRRAAAPNPVSGGGLTSQT